LSIFRRGRERDKMQGRIPSSSLICARIGEEEKIQCRSKQ